MTRTSQNRFISRTLDYETYAVRYRQGRDVYEVCAVVTDRGDWLRYPACWLYVESIDRDLKKYAEAKHLRPLAVVQRVHGWIRQLDMDR